MRTSRSCRGYAAAWDGSQSCCSNPNERLAHHHKLRRLCTRYPGCGSHSPRAWGPTTTPMNDNAASTIAENRSQLL